ncbi:hypothetical protein DWB61_04060 [Ancylomarina euxinus]|uniref:Uncharacterized protein n=1 Tax=Ancylomarina euxinus TaxID=2283627 RepID=A0A425Y516_9BACT|nr:DUF6261 family protein [Ancylomarina euxinus]MCZ4694414.1 DUF6261 family protein [Ancylomarina euxinus]MUP14256.1 hypothetical protein [Ancylomarina euxinus]RRG23577.1 hypothetical protein DWB61_04060 [Ancylomarina euxinus]
MALIKKISTSSRNGDTSTLLDLILKAFDKSDWSADTYVTPIIAKTRANSTAMTEALKRLNAYSQMAEKDDVRDMAIRSLFKLVGGYMYIPIAEIKEAALQVNNILEHYSLSILNEDYAEESADIKSLLNDLSKPDILLAIAKLQGVTQTITTADMAQKDFDNLALQQAEGESVKKYLASASQLKKASITEINDNLVGYMNTMAKVNPAVYEATAKTIAELIDKNNELVKRRSKTTEPDSELV